MAETIDRGPFVNAGSLLDNRVEPFDGPSIDYQANVIPDVRFGPIRSVGLQPGRVPSFLNSPYIVMTDAVLSAASTTTLAAAQVATSGVAMTLSTTSAGGFAAGTPSWTYNIPLIPLGTTTIATVGALDFGFATGTTAANSSTVVVQDSTYFTSGQWIVIGGAGNSTNTNPLVTQIASTVNATTIQISPVAGGALSNAPIGDANLYGSGLLPLPTQFGPSSPVPSSVNPYSVGGLAEIFNPLESVTRNIAVTASTATNGTAAILVTGYDVYGALMTELVTAAGTTTVYGKKAFKYILKAVPQQTQGANYTLGVGDVVGFHVRSDKWEYSNIFWNGTFATTKNGWTQATTVVPATNTTGDVRGTVQLSTNGSLATSVGGAAVSNGTTRLTLMMSVPLYNIINATPLNSVPMFGVANSTT